MIVFHHIIKTGGMAVLANIARCNPHLSILKRDAPFHFGGAQPPFPKLDCDLLHGHFAYERIPEGAVTFTFRRHPIARLSSVFYSLRQELRRHGITSIAELKAPVVSLGFAGGMSFTFQKDQVLFVDHIEDFIDEFLRTKGTLGLDFIPEIFTPDYSKPYDFIGITERMNESVADLSCLIPTDASKMTVINVSNSGPVEYRLRELCEFYGEEIEAWERLCAR